MKSGNVHRTSVEPASEAKVVAGGQATFVNRGEAAIERWKRIGGGHEVDGVMAALQERLDAAKNRARFPGQP